MRRLSIFLVGWSAMWCTSLPAQIEQFPYEAVVQGDNVYVRSGPGPRYYPTGKLRLGDRVTVHRHDPGGWYVISPPEGSFSWIDAGLVKRQGATTGIVQVPPLENGQPARAAVRVGSQLSDDCTVIHRYLENGDVVEILGERTLATDRGNVLMYQIKPLPAEYRWVKGDYIVPASATVREQHDRDPFGIPAAQKVPPEDAEVATAGPHRETAAEMPALPPPAESGEPLATDLESLDRELTEMLAQDPANWRLDEFDRRYRELLPSSDPVTARLIEQRLAQIAARQRAQADYLEFLRLTTETTLREEQLRRMQNGDVVTATSFPQVQLGVPQPIPDGSTIPAAGPAAPGPALPAGTQGPRLSPQTEPIPQQPPVGQMAPVLPKFDGAGIVQRSGNPLGTVPPYVLLAPDGRLLTFLEPGQGIDLEPYVGRAVGVVGQRAFDPRLQSDRTVVRRVHPVQLAP